MSRTSLRSKSVLFVAGYTLALEASVLGFYYYSGKRDIERRSREQVRAHAALARSAVERTLTDALAELEGLRAQLMLYPAPSGLRDAALRPVKEVALAAPEKYAELGVYDRATKRLFAVRVLSELSALYPVVEERGDPGLAGCPSRACVRTMPPGPREEQVAIVMPLAAGGSTDLVAWLYLDAVLDSLARLDASRGLSVVAANPRGLILLSADASLLRTYLPRPTPDAVQERLAQPEVVLIVQKDQSAELGELRLASLRIASIAGLVTLIAVVGVWALTSRMAASLHNLAEVADAVAGGDLSRRISVRRNDELGRLIDSFNAMTTRLEASYTELHEVNRQLHAKINELMRARLRLSEKQRMAAVGEALSQVSHEIQNKIGGVGVWVQNLERYSARDDNTSLCIRELKAALASFLDTLVHFKRFYREPTLSLRRVGAPGADGGSRRTRAGGVRSEATERAVRTRRLSRTARGRSRADD